MSNFLSSRLQKWRNAWSLKFYLRVYLAVLASLAVAAVILFVLMQVAMNGSDNFKRNMENFSYVASSVIPPESSGKAAEIEAIKQWGFWLDMDITVFKLDGTLSSSTKQQALTHLPSNIRVGWYSILPDKMAIQLKDQRWIIVDMSRRIYTPSAMQIIVAILVVLAIALGSYPLVRRLTKRLEHLQTSVEALGEGKLGTRVEVEGSDEVARLAHSFNQASARIESLMNAQKSLLANASHELRSPLARISMAVELVTENAPDNLRKELKQNIHELDQLVDEILLSSRLEASKDNQPEWETIDLSGLLAEECARMNAELHIKLTPEHMKLAATLRAEGKYLRRLFRNLLENAERYGDGNASDVFLTMQDEHLTVDVCDRGAGIPADQCERVFEPFYRLPGSSETNGGVGLGLSLVKQIAERHAASIACRPREGGGSCFRVKFTV